MGKGEEGRLGEGLRLRLRLRTRGFESCVWMEPDGAKVAEESEGGPGESGDLKAEFNEALGSPAEEAEPDHEVK